MEVEQLGSGKMFSVLIIDTPAFISHLALVSIHLFHMEKILGVYPVAGSMSTIRSMHCAVIHKATFLIYIQSQVSPHQLLCIQSNALVQAH